MGEHNITNESLAFSMVLVLIAIVVSYREKLGLEKDILWSICARWFSSSSSAMC